MSDPICQQQDQQQLQQRHWSVRWVYGKWPIAVKIAGIVVAICGGLGTVMGIVSSCHKVLTDHDSAVVAKAEAERDRIQRDKKIDDTLRYHGQTLYNLDKKIDKNSSEMNKKLDDITSEVKK